MDAAPRSPEACRPNGSPRSSRAVRRSSSRLSSSSILRSPSSAASSSVSSAIPCRRTRTTRPRAHRASRCTTTRMTSSASRSRARSAGSCIRPSSSCRSRTRSTRASSGEPDGPVMDVTMRAGDTLYLPRGWLHQAMTSDTRSLHLTVGINVATWRDAVRAAVDEAAEEDVLFRRGVGPDGAAPEGLFEALVSAAHARRGRTPSAPVVRRGPEDDSR